MKVNAGLSVGDFTITVLGEFDSSGQFDLLLSKSGHTSVAKNLCYYDLRLLQDFLNGLRIIMGNTN